MSDWIPLADWRRLPAAAGVYVIRHRESGKEYVGKSVSVRGRMYYHERARDVGSAIHAAVRKHGVRMFDVCVLATGAETDLNELEVAIIAQRGSYARAGGYNLTLGGEGFSGRVFTDEQRVALGNLKRGHVKSPETLARVRESCLVAAAPRRGVPRSPETRAKISEQMAGKVRPVRGPISETRKARIREARTGQMTGAANPKARAVGVWHPESMVPEVFDTARLAAAHLGVKSKSLSAWCVGKYKCPHAFRVAYL